MAYRDELDDLLSLADDIRRRIALRIGEEAGVPISSEPTQELIEAADQAIAAWFEDGEDDQDLRAFRPIGPLQQLLIDHADIIDRIHDIRDRRLS